MSSTMLQRLGRAPAWGVALGLLLVVLSFNFGVPHLVLWLWPGVDSTVLVLGNLFLGMILGSAAVMAFLVWRWEVRR